jgi:hypothetical protein
MKDINRVALSMVINLSIEGNSRTERQTRSTQ